MRLAEAFSPDNLEIEDTDILRIGNFLLYTPWRRKPGAPEVEGRMLHCEDVLDGSRNPANPSSQVV